jgi:quercetin dioxygenase-like cupin family protein
MSGRSKVIKHSGYRWQGVNLKEYKSRGEEFRGVIRQTVIGEGEGEEGVSFVTRYFEVEPGGHSSLERHQHPHVVIILRGRGEVRLENDVYPIEPFDCVFVAPDAVHQFRAGSSDPLGFLCVVDRERDRPQPLTEDGV